MAESGSPDLDHAQSPDTCPQCDAPVQARFIQDHPSARHHEGRRTVAARCTSLLCPTNLRS